MTLYTKTIDDITYILPKHKIILDKDGFQIFNPTIEMLKNDGWVEYIAPSNELIEEQLIAQDKLRVIDDIITYDSSDNVNIFYINNTPMWLDKATRGGFVSRLSAELKAGKLTTTLWYESTKFELPTELAMNWLCALELYASECYDVTQQHIVNIKQLTTLDDIKLYDYTIGYPEVLRFVF